MILSGRTVLVTGGTSGIGLGIAEAFLERGSTVIVCGRDKGRLSAVAEKHPGITALQCDVGDGRQRQDLAAEVLGRFPDLDILVNNAGIQRYVDLKKGFAELKAGEDEIAVNFVSVVELTAFFIGRLLERPSAAVINVSSGLGFMPMITTPLYSATKAAIHAYSLVLRQQLRDTAVRVVEIVPSMVDTGLNRAGRDAARLSYRGMILAHYLPTVIKGLENDVETIFDGDGAKLLSEPRGESEMRLLTRSR